MLYGLAARILDPTQPNTLEPATCHAGIPDGKSSNIMPAKVESWWGVRTMLPRKEHEEYLQTIMKEVRHVVERFPEASVEFKTIAGHPATINDSAKVTIVGGILKSNGAKVNIDHPPVLGGESFAYYLEKLPGCFWMLGAYQAGCGFHHEPDFNPDPEQFYKGVMFFLSIVTDQNRKK